jgi:glycosyltransferase involved in cell wall biosynthesis
VRILVLTFYFRPDLSAGSFRTTALVDSLLQRMPPDTHIDVLTTLPNRYASFSAEAPAQENAPGVTIRRFALGHHESGMADQSVAFLSFARQVCAAVASQPYDVVFATSSRLMTAVLGAWIARRKEAKLYLDIRDIFADTIRDVLPGATAGLAGHFFSTLERVAVRRADRVNLVSGGFLPYFLARYPKKQFSNLGNGIDDDFLAEGPMERRPSPRQGGPGVVRVLYAGNIGQGQGLDRIVPALARALGPRIQFAVVGDGGRRRELEEAVSAAGLANVDIRPPVGREALKAAYHGADVLFLHLNDYPAFHKVLPSKVFEYAAMGKPILAGVTGHAAAFMRSEVSNASIFDPCDVEGAVRALASLTLEDAPRKEFLARYARRVLSGKLADEVLALAPPAGWPGV